MITTVDDLLKWDVILIAKVDTEPGSTFKYSNGLAQGMGEKICRTPSQSPLIETLIRFLLQAGIYFGSTAHDSDQKKSGYDSDPFQHSTILQQGYRDILHK